MKDSTRKGFVIFFVFLAFSTQAAVARDTFLLPKGLLELLASEISGEEAFEHVVNLSGWPKNRSEEEYKKTFYEAKYILEKAKEYGLADTNIEYFPSEYDEWDPVSAELWIVEPFRKKLADLNRVHLCLIQYSKSTETIAELVDVGEGTSPEDYEGKDVKGKIVLCSGYEDTVNTQAVQMRGALGIICYRSLYSNEHPDMVSWGGYSQPYKNSQEKYTFGFMISPRQGSQLKQMLRNYKKVVVEARVESRTHPGKLDVINTVIKGRELPDEEIMLMAHLFEYYYKQGANDNKSGSAAILEAARVIDKLIREKKIPQPRRSIRVFWEPEGLGTFAWLKKYPEAASRLKAVIDMDMVGESHQKCGTVFRVITTPDSLPHFFNDVMRNLTEYVAIQSGIGERIESKSADELIASPAGSRDPFYHKFIHFNPRMYNETWLAAPHILFHCAPDPFYHSSEDRPDKCDPTQLKRAAFLGASAALYMAGLDERDIPRLSALVLAGGEKRLAEAQGKTLSLLAESDETDLQQNYKEALNIVRHGLQREKSTLASIGKYLHLDKHKTAMLVKLMTQKEGSVFFQVKNYYAFQCKNMNLDSSEPSLSSEEKKQDRYIPERILGLEYLADFYYLERTLKDDTIKQKLGLYKTDYLIPWEALNFADGKRSICDIRNALGAEFSPIPIPLEAVEEYFRALERAGVVRITQKKSPSE
ncbi:MAG: DUF4910 domain-containing protein [Candidatus Aminicenantes bacterium]|nr:DUF4910 domain-containing protein [Candidatus Aminicenantes bacterium]